MPRYCPAGDGAFADWVERCPECGRPLRADPPDPRPLADDEIVYLATVPNEPLARMWADVLAESGIRAMLKPLGPGMGAWASAITFEHELFVLRSELAEAQAIITALEDEESGSGS